MQINKILLKITGSIELEEEPVAGKDIILNTTLSSYEKSLRDIQDGSFDVIYKTKPCGLSEIKSGEKRIKGKDKSSNSKKLRGKIFYEGEGKNVVDHNTFYIDVINQLLIEPKYLDEIISNLDLEKYR